MGKGKKWTRILKIWIELSSRIRNNCMSSSCHGKPTVRGRRPSGLLPPLFTHRHRKWHHRAAHQHRQPAFALLLPHPPLLWRLLGTTTTLKNVKKENCSSFSVFLLSWRSKHADNTACISASLDQSYLHFPLVCYFLLSSIWKNYKYVNLSYLMPLCMPVRVCLRRVRWCSGLC